MSHVLSSLVMGPNGSDAEIVLERDTEQLSVTLQV